MNHFKVKFFNTFYGFLYLVCLDSEYHSKVQFQNIPLSSL